MFDANNKIGEIEKFILLCEELGIREINYSLNFIETNANKVSDKTIIGAAYLKKRALDMGINPVPFYLNQPWLNKIDEVACSL